MKINKSARDVIVKALKILPNKQYLCGRYYFTFHKKLNLKAPQTYNEKLQWMKL